MFSTLKRYVIQKVVTEVVKALSRPIDVKVKKLDPKAVVPKYAKAGDAGMDITAISCAEHSHYIIYHTGLAFEIPKGYGMFIFPRSSIYKKHMRLANAVPVIDSGFRGEVRLIFKKDNPALGMNSYPDFYYKEGDRVAQIVILPYPFIRFLLSEHLSTTERGEGGFGSSGT